MTINFNLNCYVNHNEAQPQAYKQKLDCDDTSGIRESKTVSHTSITERCLDDSTKRKARHGTKLKKRHIENIQPAYFHSFLQRVRSHISFARLSTMTKKIEKKTIKDERT